MSSEIAKKCFNDSVNDVLKSFTEYQIIEKDDSSVILANERKRCIGKATLCGDHVDLIYSIGGVDNVDRCVLASIKKAFFEKYRSLEISILLDKFLECSNKEQVKNLLQESILSGAISKEIFIDMIEKITNSKYNA